VAFITVLYYWWLDNNSLRFFVKAQTIMTLRQIIEDNFSSLLRSLDPSPDLLARLTSVPFIKDRISSIVKSSSPLTDDDKNFALLDALREVPDAIAESVMNGFISALRSSGRDHVADIFRRESDKIIMSHEHYELLKTKRLELCKFMNPRDGLIDWLVSFEIFSETDNAKVMNKAGLNEMAKETVNILMRKSNCAFDKFVNALNETNQSHVSYLLTGVGNPPMSDEHRRILSTKVNDIGSFVDTENGLFELLVSNGIITHHDDEQLRLAANENGVAKKLVEILLRKSDSAFYGFVNALNDTNQSHVGYLLTGVGNPPMSSEHRQMLFTNMHDLENFTDTENGLLSRLISQEVITHNDAKQIRSANDLNARARYLLEILLKKSDDVFDKFITLLREAGQAHVAHILTGKEHRRPLKEEHREKLLSGPREYLVSTIESKNSGFITTLRSKGVFSNYDAQRVTIVWPNTNDDRNEMILDLIARKSQSDFFNFISALNDTNQTHVVVELIGGDVVAKVKSVYESGTDAVHIRDVDAELLEYMQQMFQCNGVVVSRLNEILSQKGVSVSTVREGCIEITFVCKSIESLHQFQQLNDSEELEKMINEAFCSQFAEKGLKSLKVVISRDQFEQCAQTFARWVPMTSEHRKALLSSEEWLIDKITVNDALLDMLPLCRRRREAIERAETHGEQVKTLIEIVSRQPDFAFTQLLDALISTRQTEAVDIIGRDTRIETNSEASTLPNMLTSKAWENVDSGFEDLARAIEDDRTRGFELNIGIYAALQDVVRAIRRLREQKHVPLSRTTMEKIIDRGLKMWSSPPDPNAPFRKRAAGKLCILNFTVTHRIIGTIFCFSVYLAKILWVPLEMIQILHILDLR